ncbi:MAG: glycosyltransferase family 2 protein [Pseudomonadota bacterium]
MSELAVPATSTATTGARDGIELSVILPVHDERENLLPLFDEIAQALDGAGRYEIIAVDDASTDGSSELLREACAQRPALRVIRFRRQSGQTAAFDAGFRHARGSLVVTLDADGQNDPADIPRMVAELHRGCDMVSGWRRHRRDGWFLRRLPSRLANALIRRITRAPVHDLGCSLRVYRREIVQELRLYGEMHRFIAPLADSMGARISELEVNHRPRRSGRSKYGIGRTLKVLLDLLTVWFMRGYQTNPIYLFGGTGLGLFALSALVSAYVLYQKYFLGAWVHKNPLFILAVMFALMGMQALGAGLLAEVSIRTYFESQGKPTYHIAETIGFDDSRGLG